MKKTSSIIPRSKSDPAWKEILDAYLPEFLQFFYSELHAKIDWTAGYQALDKELQSITTEAMVGNRIVDKLIKVNSLEGKENFVFIHCEVQGKSEEEMEERLFIYYYRLYDRYKQPIIYLSDPNR